MLCNYYFIIWPKDGSTIKVSPADEAPPQEQAEDKPNQIKKASNKKHKSVLQHKLGMLALKIGYIGMIAALITFIILISRLLIIKLSIEKNTWTYAYIKYIRSYLIQAITVVVVAVPEGLPLAVTLALAYAVRVCFQNFSSMS